MKLSPDPNGVLGNRLRILLSHGSKRLKMPPRVDSVKLSDHGSGKVVKVSSETVINSFTRANEFLGSQGNQRPDLENPLSVAKGSKEEEFLKDRKKVSERFLLRIMGRPFDLELFKTSG